MGDENSQDFEALEAALTEELAPAGALQSLLALRIARAAWRLQRAERIEGELLGCHGVDDNLGLALIRDGNGTGAFDTLLRYRGTALAELWRALGLLKALQAEARHQAAGDPIWLDHRAARPNGPETRGNPGAIVLCPRGTKPTPLRKRTQ